jgi:dihydroorotate dehydrogenase
MISRAYRQTNGELPIIGVGGVFDSAGAWRLIAAGASLVQLYTGFVYGGPGTAFRINRGLVQLLDERGFRSVDEAVGSARG